jgi:hypothetical protein
MEAENLCQKSEVAMGFRKPRKVETLRVKAALPTCVDKNARTATCMKTLRYLLDEGCVEQGCLILGNF